MLPTQAPNTVDNDSLSSGCPCTLTTGTKLTQPLISQFSVQTSYFRYRTDPSVRAGTHRSTPKLRALYIQVIQEGETYSLYILCLELSKRDSNNESLPKRKTVYICKFKHQEPI